MSFPIRVLLIEDEPDVAELLGTACAEAVGGRVTVAVAADPSAAAAALAESEFDLVVLDVDDAPDLFRSLAREHPGVPLAVIGSAEDPDLINELLAAARREDLFGTETGQPMISFDPRDKVDVCCARIGALLRSTAELAELPLELDGKLELTASQRRAIQIFARRTGATGAKVTPLSGGLSGAVTVIVDAVDGRGMRTAHVVGKLTGIEGIPGAVGGYENAMPYMPAGLGAALAGVVSAGAGDIGAVFFRLADDHERTWFECLATAPGDAAAAVVRLRERFGDHYAHGAPEPQTFGALRRAVVTDDELALAVAPLPDLSRFEGTEIESRPGIQHRDLHGLNVLVGDSGEPLLIDYDNYAPANCALDPLTLETSAFFHRNAGAQEARRGWPTHEQARNWADLDAYLEGCPYPEAIRACRAWAEAAAASPRELSATLLAIGVRQFCFENTDKELARSIVEAGAEGLE